MGGEPLQRGELLDSRQRFFEGGSVVFHHAGAALKLIHGKAGKGRARPAGGQRMAGAGDIITPERSVNRSR